MRSLLVGALCGTIGLGPLLGTAAAQEGVTDIEELKLEDLLVITATLHEQSVMDAPAAITVITASDIKVRGYRSLPEIFADIVGFNELTDANEEIIGTRGVFSSTTNKTLFLINGHRMNDVLLGRYNVDQYLGIDAVERIEFIRGPASALYGTGALVGVVNIITKKGREIDGTKVKYQGGPFANEASLTWGKLVGDYDLMFNFTFRDQKGEEIDRPMEEDVAPMGGMKKPGKIYWRRYPENWSGIFNARSDDSEITVRGAHFRRVTPRGSNGSFFDYNTEPLRPNYTENDFFFDYKKSWTFGEGGKNKLTINPSMHYFAYSEESFITFGANDQPPLGSRSGKAAEMNNYQLKATYDRTFTDELHATLGLDGLLSSMYRTNGVNVVGAQRVEITPAGYTQTGRWRLAGLFAQAVYTPVKQISLTVGGRFDTFQKEADAKFTPRAGVVYKPMDEVAIKLLYGESYLAPQWAHKRAGNADFMGNPKLEPETFKGGDLIAVYQTKKVGVTVDLYYNQVDGLINSVRHTMGTTSYFSYENTGKSVYMGLDATGEAQVMPWLRLNAGYSFIKPNKDKTKVTGAILLADDNSILHIPTHTLRYGLRLDPISNLTLSVWGRHTGKTKTLDPILHPAAPAAMGQPANQAWSTMPSVFLLDACATYTWNKLTAQVLVSNVSNQFYERPGTVPRPLARNGLMVEGSVAYQF